MWVGVVEIVEVVLALGVEVGVEVGIRVVIRIRFLAPRRNCFSLTDKRIKWI